MTTRKRRSLADAFEDPTEPISPGVNQEAPQTGPGSTHTPDRAGSDLGSTPGATNARRGDSGGNEPAASTQALPDASLRPHTGPRPQATAPADTSLEEGVHALLAGLPRLGTPEYEAKLAEMRARTQAGAPRHVPLSKQESARLGGNLRAAAGKLVAAQERAYAAAQEWEAAVAGARAQGATHALVLVSALGAGLTDEYVPAPPRDRTSE